MKLTEQERQSALWLKLEAYLNKKLIDLRGQNDGDMSLEATARLRGRIAQCKYFLSLGETPETVQPEAD